MSNSDLEKVLTKFTNKRVLVTGSSGYIGQKASQELTKYGAEVLGIDKDVLSSNANQTQFSLISKEKTNTLIKDFKPDLIFHTGTNSALDYYNNFFISFNEDYLSLSNLLNSISMNNLDNIPLAFFSSSYVYSGEQINETVNESLKLKPNHNFGVGKRIFEDILMKSYKNFLIYRLSSVFGEGNQRKPNAIHNMIDQANKENKIDLWGNGERRMQYIHIDDVIINSFGPCLLKPGIYNLGSNDYLSTKEVINCIANAKNAKIVILDHKQEGETLPFMENKKIKQTNNFKFQNILEKIHIYSNNN